MAKENVSRPQPWPNDIGLRNWPIAERGPKAISAMAQPTAINTAGVRQDWSFGGAETVAVDIGALRHVRRRKRRAMTSR